MIHIKGKIIQKSLLIYTRAQKENKCNALVITAEIVAIPLLFLTQQ
jgi:hypothetical protein